MLAGFMVCPCGATFEAVRGRYTCSAKRRKGVCDNPIVFDVDRIDRVFLDALEDVALSPTFIDRVLHAAFASEPVDERERMTVERDRLATEIANLTKGIAAGGNLDAP